jgi:hypothetical protein
MDQGAGQGQPGPQEEFPRIIRSRMRG